MNASEKASWSKSANDSEIQNRCKGFTLIELVIVLAILLITGSMMLGFTTQDRRVLQNAGTALQGDIRYAQRLAIIEGRYYQVLFYESTNKYAIQYRIAGTSRYRLLKEVSLQDGVTIKSVNTKYLEYSPKGTNNKAFTLILENDAYTLSMTANVGAGRIAIKSIHKKAL